MSTSHRFHLRVMASALVLLSAGCAATSDGGASADGEVTVTLTEFGIELSQDTFEVGQDYTLAISNVGDAAHEVAITEPGAGMSADDDGMEGMHGDAVLEVGEDELPPGATLTRTITFDEAGDMEFACHVVGHYEAGMFTPVTVTD